LIVDDVFTSGATANELAKTLKKYNAKCVHVLALASGQTSGVKFK
jgi:predicted amidophosphoribosyltransferase